RTPSRCYVSHGAPPLVLASTPPTLSRCYVSHHHYAPRTLRPVVGIDVISSPTGGGPIASMLHQCPTSQVFPPANPTQIIPALVSESVNDCLYPVQHAPTSPSNCSRCPP